VTTPGGINLMRFTDGALYPYALDPSKAVRTGCGVVRSAAPPLTHFHGLPRYVGGALTPLATISRAELSALILAGHDLQTVSDVHATYRIPKATMVVCMDSDSCATVVEDALREGNLEALTECGDAYLVETFTTMRTELIARGCRLIIIKIPGHANPEHGIGGITMQAYADAVAKAGAWQDMSYDPELLIKRGCVALATKPLHDCAKADPEPAYTTNGASTSHIGSITADVQAQLARNAVRADDKDRSAADGRSALDRTFLGIDYPPPTKTQRPEPANAVKRWPPSPADCPPPSSRQTSVPELMSA
jgi:hypothetical protein